VLPLDAVLGPEAARLEERLHDAPAWRARFRILDAFFLTRLAAARAPAPPLAHAWRRLRETDGRIAVGALAQEVGWSRRHLVAQAREHLGLPPKTLARILRFQRAVRLLEADAGPGLAEIAADCGFYVQPHLNRDFRELAGGAPTDFLARRLPDGAGISGF